jgi:competence protein ComEA
MNKLKNFISLYFNLSKKESNGFILLCILMTIIIITPAFYRVFHSPQQQLLETDKKTLDSLVTLLEREQKRDSPMQESEKKNKQNIFYSGFNPNSSSEIEMTVSGVPGYISKRIIKFRSKGGKFKTKADLRKIYGLKESDFKKLYPYINIDENTKQILGLQPNKPFTKTYNTNALSKQIINLNTTDSLQLISLKGIGPAFASRILKYRKKLGGFVSKEQLKEVYGLDSIVLNGIISNFTIDKNFMPEKIKINTTYTPLLSSHPYIGKKTAQLIVNYFIQHGNYTSLEQLRNIKLITEENYLKMLPYLSLE